MMSITSSDRKSLRRWIQLLIAGVVVAIATFYVIRHREHRMAAVVFREQRPKVRATTTTPSATHDFSVSAASSSGGQATTGTPAASTHLALVIPSPTATGPATEKYLRQSAAGVKRHLEQYDPNAATDIPIVMDVMYGRVQKLSERLDAGLDPNRAVKMGPNPEDTETLLSFAIGAGQRAVIKGLVDRGASTNLGSPLIEAANLSETDVVKFLLDHGANPNQTGVLGHTAMRDAIIMGDYSMVKVLLRAGADPNQIGGRAKNYLNHSTKPTVVAIRKLLNEG